MIGDIVNQLKEKDERIASLESQLMDKDEEIASWKEERDNVLNDFELYRAEKDKEIEAFKDIENIRSQATKNLCKENYDLRDEIERLNAIRDSIIDITFGAGSHQERIRLIKDALKIS